MLVAIVNPSKSKIISSCRARDQSRRRSIVNRVGANLRVVEVLKIHNALPERRRCYNEQTKDIECSFHLRRRVMDRTATPRPISAIVEGSGTE